MPEISRFYGIAIRMFSADHAPPLFHAIYGDDELIVGIYPIRIIAGSSSNRVRSMVLGWAALHQDELMVDWERCRSAQVPHPIAPLD